MSRKTILKGKERKNIEYNTKTKRKNNIYEDTKDANFLVLMRMRKLLWQVTAYIFMAAE